MQLLVVQRILGLLVALFSIAMLPSAGISLYYRDGATTAFLLSALILVVGGLAIWYPARKAKHDLRLRDGFLVVVAFWSALGVSGALPLYLAAELDMSLTDAVFESVSGITTTGATVLTGLDELPHSILFYRQFIQWLGGLGIIVLAVAVLPMLGVGGMQLYRAETPGPMKDNKLTPRIAGTAKALWYIYVSLTAVCAFAYWLAGMTPFDAITHSFSTIAIGGFSTHDASIAYFQNPAIEAVAIIFMLVAAMNFALHFTAVRSRQLDHYFSDSELKFFFLVLLLISSITTLELYFTNTYPNFTEALRYGVFQTVSITTTTGFTTSGFYTWPSFLPVLLLFASFMGGCAASTGGGLKVIRVLLLFKQGAREITRLIHPSAVVTIKINGAQLPDRVLEAVWGFFAAYIGVFGVLMLAVMFTGLDQITAFSAVAASLNNLGPGLGKIGLHYQDINNTAKWILSLAMLLGRLEIFTVLVIISPAFWRR